MKLQEFKNKLESTPTKIAFEDTMSVIEANYDFTATAFKNGSLQNEAGQNSGSCKLFAFAVDQQLTVDQTLACFGQYYFGEVLNDPAGNGHQNIRNFINTGFEGLTFEKTSLVLK